MSQALEMAQNSISACASGLRAPKPGTGAPTQCPTRGASRVGSVPKSGRPNVAEGAVHGACREVDVWVRRRRRVVKSVSLQRRTWVK